MMAVRVFYEKGAVKKAAQRKRLEHLDSLPACSREDMPKDTATTLLCSMFMP
jgi:hypothetical protein